MVGSEWSLPPAPPPMKVVPPPPLFFLEWIYKRSAGYTHSVWELCKGYMPPRTHPSHRVREALQGMKTILTHVSRQLETYCDLLDSKNDRVPGSKVDVNSSHNEICIQLYICGEMLVAPLLNSLT